MDSDFVQFFQDGTKNENTFWDLATFKETLRTYYIGGHSSSSSEGCQLPCIYQKYKKSQFGLKMWPPRVANTRWQLFHQNVWWYFLSQLKTREAVVHNSMQQKFLGHFTICFISIDIERKCNCAWMFMKKFTSLVLYSVYILIKKILLI